MIADALVKRARTVEVEDVVFFFSLEVTAEATDKCEVILSGADATFFLGTGAASKIKSSSH